MKNKIKNILLNLPGFQALCRQLTRKHVRTLMYHRFDNEYRSGSPRVCVRTLEEQLSYIRRYHANWSPQEHVDALEGKRKWSSAPVVITIDDGYRDFYQVAYPLLTEYSMKAMLFVTTNFVEKHCLLWWDRLRFMLNHTSKIYLDVVLGGKSVTLKLAASQDRDLAWSLIADHCRFMPHLEKEQLLDDLAVKLDVSPDLVEPEDDKAVSWDELKEMVDSGLLVGAHTLNHPILSRLQRTQVIEEISGSKRVLEDKLNRDINWFCYPQGGPADFSEETKEIVGSLGFHGCYVAYQTMVYDKYTLPRYGASKDMSDFKWTLCGAEYIILVLRKLLRKQADMGESYWRGSESWVKPNQFKGTNDVNDK